MTNPREQRTFEEIVDICIDQISAGRMAIEDALDRWPEHREELEPLLRAAFAIAALPPVAEQAPDPERRADFLSQIRQTPQDAPTKRRGFALPSLGGLFSGLPRLATLAAPAAAVAVIAVMLTLGGGAAPASASTLTVFTGSVEREEGGNWVVLADGAELEAGDRLRTSGDGEALLTFADGSTAALDGATELVIEQASVNGERTIELNQVTGRIWNDVAPGATPASYVVRTVDAVITARGTVFETVVTDGETSVVTAEGTVDVAGGDEHSSVTAGQVLRVARQRVVDAVRDHQATVAPVTMTIEGPFVASLRSESGAATGALPNGVTFQQIPGVATSDPADGAQVLQFYDIEPGVYDFTIRRIGDAGDRGGWLIVETPNGGRDVPLKPTLGVVTLSLRISLAEGRVALQLLDAEPRPTSDAVRERIADSQRLTDARPVIEVRPARDGAVPTATPSMDATRVTDGMTVEPSATATPSDGSDAIGDLETRLRRVLSFEEPERRFALRLLLEELGRSEDAWLKLRQVLLERDGLRRVFLETVAGFESEELKAAIRERLGFGDSSDGSTSLSTATPVATATATTVAPSDVDSTTDATVTATATPSASLDSTTR